MNEKIIKMNQQTNNSEIKTPKSQQKDYSETQKMDMYIQDIPMLSEEEKKRIKHKLTLKPNYEEVFKIIDEKVDLLKNRQDTIERNSSLALYILREKFKVTEQEMVDYANEFEEKVQKESQRANKKLLELLKNNPDGSFTKEDILKALSQDDKGE